jgi:thioesterase domain-containing protein/acyl carrier protein
METQQICTGTTVEGAEAHLPEREIIDDDISRQLIHIWQEILGVESIRLDQNYFDLGGDSSLALQMFSRIEDVFKIKLPLATLYEAPTVDELAGILRGEVSLSRWSPLVAIQPNGSRPPFFCVHAHGGNVLVYRELSRQLGSDQPFFGLQSPGLDGSQAPITKIEDMAVLYLKEIRRVQPHGPYFLGGYCMGGAVAYDAACQLRAAGEEVALLALFDTLEFSTFPPPSFWQMSYYHCQRFLFHLADLLRLNSHDRPKFISEKVRSLRVRIPVWLGRFTGRLRKSSRESGSSSEAQVLDQVWRANFEAHLRYAAKPYPGTVTDIRPRKQYRLLDGPQFKWERLAVGGQKIVVLPVNPPSMLSDPFVRHLAIALRKCLDEAMEGSQSFPDRFGILGNPRANRLAKRVTSRQSAHVSGNEYV